MAVRNPDWHLYRAFLSVVHEGSLSGAARAVGATQPTLGRQVAALETALGVKLFTRSLNGLSPTEAGMRLIPSAEAMAAAAEAARRSISGEADEARGTVRVTASEIVGGEIIPSMCAQFRALHPRIAVEVSLSNRNEDLLRGDADIAIRMVRPTQGALLARRIGRIDLGLYAHKRYLKAHGVPRTLEDLRSHALIGFDRGQTYARLLERMGMPFTRDLFAFRSDSDLAQLAALRAGCGIGVSQLGIARRDKNLIPVLHAGLLIPMEIWLVMHRDLRDSHRIRLLFEHLAKGLSTYAAGSRLTSGPSGRADH
jgi:DNA-binding transcriptional LysR family regulator